jgi:hypothetical protein
MHDEDTPYPGERYDTLELMALHAMTGDAQPIWSLEDLGRHLDDPSGTTDAVYGLRTAGLVHQTSDGFVFATRAADRLIEITGKVG